MKVSQYKARDGGRTGVGAAGVRAGLAAASAPLSITSPTDFRVTTSKSPPFGPAGII